MIKRTLLWGLLFLANALILTWPLALFMTTHITGDGADGSVFVWNLWWARFSTAHLSNPFHSDFLFAPYGVSLTFHTLTLLTGLLSLPLQPLLGLIATFNLLFLASFVLTGYGMVYLLSGLGLGLPAQAVGSLLFTFCPFVLARSMGHFNLTTTWPLVWGLALALSYRRQNSVKTALALGVVLGLGLLNDFHYPLFFLYLLCLFVIYDATRTDRVKRLKQTLTLALYSLASCVLVAWPLLISAFRRLLAGEFARTSVREQQAFSLDLTSFFLPDPLHPLWGAPVAAVRERWHTGLIEQSGYLGSVCLVLVLIGLVLAARGKVSRACLRWIVAGLVFALLALGPWLSSTGISRWALGPLHFSVPLPFLALGQLPLFNVLRTPGRLVVLTSLCFAVAASMTLDYLFRSGQRKYRMPRLFGILGVLLLDILPSPYPLHNMKIPDFYRDNQAFAEVSTILDIPVGWRSGSLHLGNLQSRLQYYQSAHEKKLVGGYVSRVPDNLMYALSSYPGMEIFTEPWRIQPWERSNNLASGEEIKLALTELGVDALVIHRDLMAAPVVPYLQEYCESLGYQVRAQSPESILLVLTSP